jgi:hypothetical protein
MEERRKTNLGSSRTNHRAEDVDSRYATEPVFREYAEPEQRASLAKREPLRIAEGVATLVGLIALVGFNVELTADQVEAIRDVIVSAIPIIVPIIAGFEVARSRVDSPATVERKLRETKRRAATDPNERPERKR